MAFKFLKKVNPQKIFDDISSGIDKSNLTNEEASELNIDIWKGQIEFAKNDANANTTSSKARRTLAKWTAGVYLGGKALAMLLEFITIFNISSFTTIDKVMTAASNINGYANSVGVFFGGVMTYYFGVYVFNKIRSTKELKSELKDKK